MMQTALTQYGAPGRVMAGPISHTSIKVHSLNSGKDAATPILKSLPSQFSPFIL